MATRPLCVLDLDETLIYTTGQLLPWPYHFTVFQHFKVHVRPHLDEFLRAVAIHYDLAIWTAASADYAEAILKQIQGNAKFEFIWTRNRCTQRRDFRGHGMYDQPESYTVKDFKKVRRLGRDLKRCLLVDDTPKNADRNYGNLVPIRDFQGDPNDRELLALGRYLTELASEPDFRKIEKRLWRGKVFV